ncbi:MAG: Alpha-N-arabinofuranosidase [Verrucomicrobiales bacterium]|nr:Alpha-N-arabinofuranosidase [Verrucomicrobiales bacterium]
MTINPLISTPAADPWIVFHEGHYYFCESRAHATIHIRKSDSISKIGHDEGKLVWSPPKQGGNSKGVWAPELHFFEGRWYIYYAADDGQNENHRMWVLESDSSDPLGTYHCKGSLETDGWAIDGTVLSMDNGKRYFIWSGWPGAIDGQQNLYVAEMDSPFHLCSERRLLAEPTEEWERVAMPICEGPQVLRNGSRTFIVYSASGSWTEDYCLGMMELIGQDVMNRASWQKTGPVFRKTERVWGVGHCSFVKSPCRSEDWILFHAKSERTHGWLDRRVHAQRFDWTEDGVPQFGTPLGS